MEAKDIILVTFGSNIPLFGNSEGSISTLKGFKIEFVDVCGLLFLEVRKDGQDYIELVNFANIKGLRVNGESRAVQGALKSITSGLKKADNKQSKGNKLL